MTTWAITGGRERHPTDIELEIFASLVRALNITRVVHGDCRGTDKYVGHFAKHTLGCKLIVMPARWRRPDGSIDYRAGHERNGRMLKRVRECDADGGLIAFTGGTGTLNCINQACEMQMPVYCISPLGQVYDYRDRRTTYRSAGVT